MRNFTVLISLMVILCSGPLFVEAQATVTDPPLLISGYYGDEIRQDVLFQYVNDAWEQLPVGEFYTASLSPDGEHLALLTLPPLLREIPGGLDWLWGSAWDITLVDLKDGSRIEIATQPASAGADADENGYSGGINRGTPLWSSDGRALAWIEQDYPARPPAARLVVHDLDSGVSRVLDDTIPQMGLSADGFPSFFDWGRAGVVVFTNDPSDSVETLRFYDVEAGLQKVIRVPDDEGQWIPLTGPLWLDAPAEPGGAVVVVQVSDRTWNRINPLTSEVAWAGSRLEMVSAASPAESLRLVWGIYHYLSEPVEPALQLLSADGASLLTWDDLPGAQASTSPTQFVFAPSGQAAAYIEDGTLYRWQAGRVEEIAGPPDLHIATLYWGPAEWQMGMRYESESFG